MVEDYEASKKFTSKSAEGVKELMNDFFKKNDNLLCSDIYNYDNEETIYKQTQLYKGFCAMGYHFPSFNQWLTKQFVGSKDWAMLTIDIGCIEDGTTGVKLNFHEGCDSAAFDPNLKADIESKDEHWWSKEKPLTTLPFYGRFFHKLLAAATDEEKPKFEYSNGKEKSWSAIWAAMWMHGRFQGFPNLAKAANGHRRNLGGLKGEYTLGPLTIPAHFGTPEDKQ